VTIEESASGRVKPEVALVLSQADGRIVAGNAVWRRWFAEAAQCVWLKDAAVRLACPALAEALDEFTAKPAEALQTSWRVADRAYWIRLHRLGGWLLLEIAEVPQASGAVEREQALLAQMGRLTSRLIHDFKNQMGGLKLYASYLKKRLAAADLGAAGKESAEIAEKIVENLNVMAENATLVSRLAKPVELQRVPGKLALVVEQALNDQRARVEERQIKLVNRVAETVEMEFDATQLRLALNTFLTRAVEVSPVNGQVIVELQRMAESCVLSVTDQGAPLTDLQRRTLFDFVTNERLNRTALELGHAKQVVEAHGGTVTAEAVESGGTVVCVRLPSEVEDGLASVPP
jgi:signal transduction histidine kinase